MANKPANENTLKFTDVKYAKDNLGVWGKYAEKVKWKLEFKAKNRGFVLQVVKFNWVIKWASNDQLLTTTEISSAMGRDMNTWKEYSELWLISQGNQTPSSTLNQDHFSFGGIQNTYGFMEETGEAYFFESSDTPEGLGFSKNPYCPAGEYMPSKQGVYVPGTPINKTATINHKVKVTWDKSGTTTLDEEIPKKPLIPGL